MKKYEIFLKHPAKQKLGIGPPCFVCQNIFAPIVLLMDKFRIRFAAELDLLAFSKIWSICQFGRCWYFHKSYQAPA